MPAATASGLDPAALHAVPWAARWAIAAAPTTAAAAEMLNRYSGADAEDAVAIDRGMNPARFDDATAYERSFSAWMSGFSRPASPAL